MSKLDDLFALEAQADGPPQRQGLGVVSSLQIDGGWVARRRNRVLVA